MVEIKAVLFDLHGTLAYMKKPVRAEDISAHLFNRDYEVSPQQLRASWMFVAFVDYPKYGYKNWYSYFSRIFWRLKVKVDEKTLVGIVRLLESNPYKLHSDATEAVVTAKETGLKTAVVTTIARFQFKSAISPIKKYLDLIMTDYEARCDKTNPKMHRRVLEILQVKPSEAVMIGDTLEVDVILPRQLGIHAILLDREGKNPKCQAASAVVSNLREALEIISGFQTR